MRVTHYALDPYSSRFACAIKSQGKKEGCIYHFNPSSPLPIDTTPLNSKVYGLLFIPQIQKKSALVVLDSDFELSLHDKSAVTESGEIPQPDVIGNKSLFSGLYGSSVFTKSTTQVPTTSSATKVGIDALSFLDAPSHIVAAPSRLVESFMSLMLAPKPLLPEPVFDADMVEMETGSEIQGGENTSPVLESYDFLSGVFEKLAVAPAPAVVGVTPQKVVAVLGSDGGVKGKSGDTVGVPLSKGKSPAKGAGKKSKKRSVSETQ